MTKEETIIIANSFALGIVKEDIEGEDEGVEEVGVEEEGVEEEKSPTQTPPHHVNISLNIEPMIVYNIQQLILND